MALNTIVVKVCMCIPFAGKSSLFFCELFKVASGVFFFHIIGKNRTHRLRQQNPICCVAKKRNNNGEEPLRRAEEEEEKGEGKSCSGGSSGYGAVEAWTDEVMDRIGVASRGCVCLACDFELNRTDRFFFSKVNRESWSVLAYAGGRAIIEITMVCSRMFIHLDVGMGVE